MCKSNCICALACTLIIFQLHVSLMNLNISTLVFSLVWKPLHR